LISILNCFKSLLIIELIFNFIIFPYPIIVCFQLALIMNKSSILVPLLSMIIILTSLSFVDTLHYCIRDSLRIKVVTIIYSLFILLISLTSLLYTSLHSFNMLKVITLPLALPLIKHSDLIDSVVMILEFCLFLSVIPYLLHYVRKLVSNEVKIIDNVMTIYTSPIVEKVISKELVIAEDFVIRIAEFRSIIKFLLSIILIICLVVLITDFLNLFFHDYVFMIALIFIFMTIAFTVERSCEC